MPSLSKSHRGLADGALLVALCVIVTAGTLTRAQDQPSPKWEFFGGYSVFDPGADVHGVVPGGVLPVSSRLEWNPRGIGASVTYDINRWLGLTLDASTSFGSNEAGLLKRIDDTAFSNLSLGPKFTLRRGRFSPFFEGLAGGHRLMPDALHDISTFGFMGGGGLDVGASRHVALRLIRADYVMSSYRYGPRATTSSTDLNGLRLQAGLNFTWGGGRSSASPAATCSIDPAEVFAGDPLTARADGSGFNSSVKYSWSGSAANVTGTDASTRIDTMGLPPGAYQVSANLTDGSKNGLASCSTQFTVKPPHPPEITCSSDPSTVLTGTTANISAHASSPDSRRLRYSYSVTAGTISGSDAMVTLNAGTQAGAAIVTCFVSDDHNPALTASAMTRVMVEAPPAAEVSDLETKLALHSIYFQTARPTEKAPGGGILESQEKILISLASGFSRYLTFKPEAHLILGGHADSRGTPEYNKALSGRRVDSTRSFLIAHGVPAKYIEVRSFGEEDELSADQVKEQIARNPDVSENDRQKMLNNLAVIVLANNRRVDVWLSTNGQHSVRRYPFNAEDALELLSTKGVDKEPATRREPGKK